MKIIVTGAAGFIGKNFLLKANKKWELYAVDRSTSELNKFVKENNLANIKTFECNLSDKDEVKKLFDKLNCTFDVCLYLAANSDPNFSIQFPGEDLAANTAALVNFLSCLAAKKFIFFSSGAVYHGLSGPVNPKTKLNPLLPYSISKYASEQYIKFFNTTKSIENYLIVRFFGAYGPYEPPRKITSKLIRSILIEGKDSYEVYGDGENLIDIMYIDDTIDCILAMIKNKNVRNEVFDLCTGKPVAINSFVINIARILKRGEIKISHNGVSHENIMFVVSPKKAISLFGFKQKVTLEKGIIGLAKFLKK